MADRFEYTRIYVPLGYFRNATNLIGWKTMVAEGVVVEASNEAWSKVKELGEEGWELVSTVPNISSAANDLPNQVMVFTGGYIMIFKRKIE